MAYFKVYTAFTPLGNTGKNMMYSVLPTVLPHRKSGLRRKYIIYFYHTNNVVLTIISDIKRTKFHQSNINSTTYTLFGRDIHSCAGLHNTANSAFQQPNKNIQPIEIGY